MYFDGILQYLAKGYERSEVLKFLSLMYSFFKTSNGFALIYSLFLKSLPIKSMTRTSPKEHKIIF